MKAKLKDGTEIEGTPQEIKYILAEKEQPQETKEGIPQIQRYKPLTKEAIQYIQEHFQKENKHELAKSMGISEPTLYRLYRKAVGYFPKGTYRKKLSFFIQKEIEERYPKEGIGLAKKLGIGESTLYKYAAKLKATPKHQPTMQTTKICKTCQGIIHRHTKSDWGWQRTYLCPKCWIKQVVTKAPSHQNQQPTFPTITTAKAPQKIVQKIITHAIKNNGTIGIKDYYALGIEYKTDWDKIATEIILKSEQICNYLSVANKLTLNPATGEISDAVY